MIDLRSDTVTRPTPAMREAMMAAEVGDDVFGEDPTVGRLEERVAELLGKEAALFVPSGVMGNQLAVKIQTEPGDEVLVERDAHIVFYESGAPGAVSGVQLRTIPGEDGKVQPDQIDAAMRHGYDWEPRSRLLCLENTHNRAGGVVLPAELLQATAARAHAHGLAVHLDGARLWNAAVATGVEIAEFAAPVDTVSVCLSKGLGAPVGSVLAGPSDLMRRARRFRKMLGGGMRQVGFLAAAGLYALDHHVSRLVEDHRNARRLAEGLARLPRCMVDPDSVETNIVMFEVDGSAVEFIEAFGRVGVRMVPFGPHRIRATTHLDVDADDIERALGAIEDVLTASSATAPSA